MTKPAAAEAFLRSAVEDLERFDFVGIVPSAHPLNAIEVTRVETDALEVRVPGRPPLLPALEQRVRASLRERGFASEAPDDTTRPWVKSVADTEEALATVETLLREVFDEAPDADLDFRHGSHRLEYEAQQKLGVIRERVERVITEMLGSPPEQDDEHDYVLPVGDVRVSVSPRSVPNGQVVIRIACLTNVGLEPSGELGLFLGQLNFGLMFGRFALDSMRRAVWIDETLLGDHFDDDELRFVIEIVASTADEWDDRIKQMFGGATLREVIASRDAQALSSTKPGEGVGQYL